MFCSSKVETFLLQNFFQKFWGSRDDIVVNFSITAQIFIDIQNTPDSRSSAKFLESQLLYRYHVLQSFFPISKTIAFHGAVAFYVQAKKPENERKIYNKADSHFCKKCQFSFFLVQK